MDNPNVLKGAARLDEHRPGWENEIALQHLYMKNCSLCVLGQLYTEYSLGLKALGIFGAGSEYGFYSPDSRGFHILDQDWRDLILARRSVAQ